MNEPANPEDEVQRLFQKHVLEVAAGIIELVSIAREVGDRVLVAVRSNDPSIHAVSACVGAGGEHPRNIMRELGGERVGIVLWSASPEDFILGALAPHGPAGVIVQTPKISLDVESRTAHVEVDQETLTFLWEQSGSRVRLAARLVSWDIGIVSNEGKRFA